MSELPSLFAFDAATAVRAGGDDAVRNLTWTVREGETWAVVGPTGAGKTALAETLVGRHRVQSGTLAWPLLDRLRAAGRRLAWPADVVHLVAFKEESSQFSYARHYYQQRFNFVEPQDDLILADFLATGVSASDAELHAATERLGVGDLLPLSLIKLSNGQMRRARLARALLAKPELLILDDPFLGLDAAGRADVSDLLGGLVRDGLRLILITRPEAIPAWVTHVLEIEHLTAAWQGLYRRARRATEGRPRPEDAAPSLARRAQQDTALIDLRHVTVRYGDRAILDDVSWIVRAGERWAVLGPNGSGKSTLLSLVCADHPQAYSNDVWVFGRRRGTGESIWEVKRRIGLVSPELHVYFTAPLTAFETAATGFFDVLTHRPVTAEQAAAVRRLLTEFGIADFADRPFARLSTGEQRLILLVRALVKDPPLLILDEPFQGLDAPTIQRTRDWLDERLRPDQTLVFVSHYEGEIPRTVTHHLRLSGGRVTPYTT